MARLAAFARSCVATPLNIVLTILVLVLLARTLPELIQWSLIDAVWSGSSARACEGHDAACWVFVRIRFSQLMYGPYPAPERWRIDAVALFALAVIVIAFATRRVIGLLLLCALPLIAAPLLAGGVLGLKPVPTSDWGGMMLNILIALWSIATAIPVGLMLALGRRSAMPIIA